MYKNLFMDKLQWFKFSPTDWMMGKVQRVPELTQIRYIRLVCLYWNKECILSYEDAEIECDAKHLNILISKKIVKELNGFICIDFLNEQMINVENISSKRRESANERWKKNKQNDANALQLNKDALQIYAEESREEKIDNNLTVKWDKLLEQFNEVTGKKSKVINAKVKASVLARLKEGYTKDDLLKAITNCFNDPYHKDTGHKYLTLEFISRPDKIEKYSTMNPLKIKKDNSDKIGML